jgi:hypothetical protein
MEVEMNVTASGAATGTILVSIPPGYTIDSAKLARADSGDNLGVCQAFVASSTYTGVVYFNSADTTKVGFFGNLTNSWNATTPATWTSGNYVCARIFIPITGLSSSVQMSNDTDTRVVAARAVLTTTQATSGLTIINFPTITLDTHGAITTGASWKFTAPVSGYYRVAANVFMSAATYAVNNSSNVFVYKNASLYATAWSQAQTTSSINLTPQIETILSLNAGDYLDIRINTTGNPNVYGDVNNPTEVSINRLSGPASIAATETVAARYYTTAGQTVNTTATVVNFDTKDYDTHGAVTTGGSWKFTAPIAGKYRVSGELIYAAARNTLWFIVYKNGSSFYWNGVSCSATSTITQGSGTISLLAGDYITVYTYVDTSSTTLNTAAGHNWLCIERVGN